MSLKIDNQTYFNQVTTPNWEIPPIVVAWKFSSPENLGALLRICDNFGVKKVFFVGEPSEYKRVKIKRNATTSFNKIEWTFVDDTKIWSLIPKEYLKLAIDTTSESVALNDFDFNKIMKSSNSFCFFFGNETTGLEDATIKKSDASIHIPMIGNSFSMNVVQAAAVVLFETVRQCLISKS